MASLAGVLALLAAALYGWYARNATPTDVWLPRATCDLNAGACRQTLPNGASVVFAITPHPIPSMEDLTLSAAFSAATPERVDVDLNGTTMKMAANQPRLLPVGNNRFEGQTALSVCVTGAMQWQAVLSAEFGGTRYNLPFVFDAAHAALTDADRP
ncbi:hypothetical protein [Denitromonas iodatirespirans]|uniref:Uncharacterized protein n=1 Tax=Denitromonas iodatirespirans TaxID=2795389 RepID=A0A944HCW0_DENI1|nr:hypothetical protein [Denitromonas iodatirespirans]MBT0963112.1 hypothetical protein [Denitromonas iodatirespirans]